MRKKPATNRLPAARLPRAQKRLMQMMRITQAPLLMHKLMPKQKPSLPLKEAGAKRRNRQLMPLLIIIRKIIRMQKRMHRQSQNAHRAKRKPQQITIPPTPNRLKNQHPKHASKQALPIFRLLMSILYLANPKRKAGGHANQATTAYFLANHLAAGLHPSGQTVSGFCHVFG